MNPTNEDAHHEAHQEAHEDKTDAGPKAKLDKGMVIIAASLILGLVLLIVLNMN